MVKSSSQTKITELPVARIENGTIIDHIANGQALNIMNTLSLTSSYQITVGINLSSKSMGHKDLIKIKDKYISIEESKKIAIFAPNATINKIESYTLTKKYKVQLPKTIKRIFKCPNLNCITNHEVIETYFNVIDMKKKVLLNCYYCDSSFSYYEKEEQLNLL